MSSQVPEEYLQAQAEGAKKKTNSRLKGNLKNAWQKFAGSPWSIKQATENGITAPQGNSAQPNKGTNPPAKSPEEIGKDLVQAGKDLKTVVTSENKGETIEKIKQRDANKTSEQPKPPKTEDKPPQKVEPTGPTGDDSTPGTPDTPGTPKEKGNFDSIDYEREARASLEANGLGKYIGEDGKIDSKKLKRSKWGMAALNALLGGIAGFGAGIAGRDAPDMSNGMLGQHIGKLQEASDLTQQAAANKTQDERDLDTFTKQLNLGTEAQKNLAQAMIDMDMAKRDKLWKSLQAISDPAERNDFLRTYVGASEDIKDSLLRGGWKTVKESGVGRAIGDLFKSDEGCKRFATRSVFR